MWVVSGVQRDFSQYVRFKRSDHVDLFLSGTSFRLFFFSSCRFFLYVFVEDLLNVFIGIWGGSIFLELRGFDVLSFEIRQNLF